MNKDKESIKRRVDELSFVKVETELFLDTHPDCRQALDYYHRILDELRAAELEYINAYGPLVASESSTERWNWVDTPWPWQMMGEKKEGGKS